MRTLKITIGLIGAALPVLYCGGLLYYFYGVGGSAQGVAAIGLGPTVLGLGAVALLFLVPFALKLMRLFAAPASPRSSGGAGPDAPEPEAESSFDPDAALARYMARKAAQGGAPASAPSPQGDGTAIRRPSFGRKTG